MNPKPFVALNHFTVPVAMARSSQTDRRTYLSGHPLQGPAEAHRLPAFGRAAMPKTPQTESRETSAMKTFEVVAKLTEAQGVSKAQANSRCCDRARGSFGRNPQSAHPVRHSRAANSPAIIGPIVSHSVRRRSRISLLPSSDPRHRRHRRHRLPHATFPSYQLRAFVTIAAPDQSVRLPTKSDIDRAPLSAPDSDEATRTKGSGICATSSSPRRLCTVSSAMANYGSNGLSQKIRPLIWKSRYSFAQNAAMCARSR